MARYNVDHKEHIISIRFTEDGWQDLEYLSDSLGLPKAKVLRKAIEELARTVRIARSILEEG